MFGAVTAYTEPYAYWRVGHALADADLQWLDTRMAAVTDWVLHDDAFYRAWLHVEPVPPRLAAELAEAMRGLTGAPLTDTVTLTLQQMRPDQYALPHTDRPLCGYEAARLVLQLNVDWEPEQGGILAIHPDARGQVTVREHLPERNSAFAFVMGPESFHSVAPTRRLRRTAVFNFWHVGNTEAMARWAKAEMAALRFSDLPAELDPLIDEADACCDPDDTLRAGRVACLLHRWGFEPDTVARGYRAALRPLERVEGDEPELLARWVDHVVHESFPTALWARVVARLGPADPRLAEVRRWCFSID